MDAHDRQPAETDGDQGVNVVQTTVGTDTATSACGVKRRYPLRVYVAGQYSKRFALNLRVKEMEASMGVIVTHNWMTYEEGHTCEQKASYAFEDIRGVQTADVVIAVMDDAEYAFRGTFGEMCAALALGRPVFVVTPPHDGEWYCETNVFYWHPAIRRFPTWEAALSALATTTV